MYKTGIATAFASLTVVMFVQLAEGVSSVIHDRSVRVVILRSDVPGMFCAGADLKVFTIMFL